MALENVFGDLALNETLIATNTKLDAIIAELSQKLESGEEVALNNATLLALESVNASISNFPSDFPDASVLAKLEAIRILLSGTLSVNIGLTDAQLRATAIAIVASTLPLPTGAATDAKLDSILAKLITSPATESKQDTANTSLSTIAGKDFALEATLQQVRDKLPLPIVDMPLSDTLAIPVRTAPEKYIDCSFANVGSGLLTTDFELKSTGAGMTISQSAGNLVIATGITINSESVIRGITSVNGALTLKSIITLSQRIANNNFFVELVDIIGDLLAYNIVNATTVDVTKVSHGFTAQNVGQRIDLCALSSVGVPMEGVIASVPNADTIRFTVSGWPASGSGTLSLTGYNKIELLYSGTTATNALFNTRRKGWQNTAVTATINTSASGHLASINSENGISSLSDKTLVAGNALTDRTAWDANIPQPNIDLFVQIRAKNGTIAPATNTTWTIGMIRVEDYIPTQVSMVSTRQQTLNSSIPVKVISAPSTPVTGTIIANQGTASATAWLANPLNPAVSLTGDTGAKTATFNGATQTNTTGKGVQVVLNVGAVTGTSPTLVCKIQGSADGGTTWFDIPNAVTATIIATGVYGLQIYPNIAVVAGVATSGTIAQISSVLPRTWRVVYTIGGTTPSFTITNAQINYLL